MTARMPVHVRGELLIRCLGRCEACGQELTDAMHVHHRRPRAMGGTSRDDVHSLANLLALHPACHARVESRRSESLARGLLCLQNEDPADVPVLIAGRRWARLRPDGTYEDLR